MEPAVDPVRTHESFSRLLFVADVAVLATTAAWLSQNYPPDRWLISSWIGFVTSVAFVLGSELVPRFFGAHDRVRRWLDLGAALSFLVGLCLMIAFASEQGLDDEPNDSYAAVERDRF